MGGVSGQEKYEFPNGVERFISGAGCLSPPCYLSPGCAFIGVVDQPLACRDQKIVGRLLKIRDRLAHRAHLFAQLA